VKVPSVLAALAALLVLVTGLAEFRASAAAQQAQGALAGALELPADRRAPVARFAGLRAGRATAATPGEDQMWRLRCDAALAGTVGLPNGPARDSLAADALASARRAAALEPRRGSNFDRMANAYAALGRWAEADSAFDVAEALAPVDPFVRLDRHHSEMARGRPDLALRTARGLVALYPEEATSHAAEAAAWLGMDRRPPAIDALRRALAARWEPGSEDRHEAARRWLRALEGDSLPGRSQR
jgi:tetratricopeptide (TPR) repeat protein